MTRARRCCKIITIVGNTGSPSKADTQIAVPVRPKKDPRCNCYKVRGKHAPSTCATIPDSR